MHKVSVALGPDKGRVFQLAVGDPVTIGRRVTQVLLNDHSVSRLHAQFFIRGNRWWLVDLGSTNGTSVNGRRVTRPVRLTGGDQIQIGRSILVFHAVPMSTPTLQTAPTIPAQAPAAPRRAGGAPTRTGSAQRTGADAASRQAPAGSAVADRQALDALARHINSSGAGGAPAPATPQRKANGELRPAVPGVTAPQPHTTPHSATGLPTPRPVVDPGAQIRTPTVPRRDAGPTATPDRAPIQQGARALRTTTPRPYTAPRPAPPNKTQTRVDQTPEPASLEGPQRCGEPHSGAIHPDDATADQVVHADCAQSDVAEQVTAAIHTAVHTDLSAGMAPVGEQTLIERAPDSDVAPDELAELSAAAIDGAPTIEVADHERRRGGRPQRPGVPTAVPPPVVSQHEAEDERLETDYHYVVREERQRQVKRWQLALSLVTVLVLLVALSQLLLWSSADNGGTGSPENATGAATMPGGNADTPAPSPAVETKSRAERTADVLAAVRRKVGSESNTSAEGEPPPDSEQDRTTDRP